MKSYLLFFLSIMLLLFTLPNQGSKVNSLPGMEQGVVKKGCTSKRLVKRTCRKGCLKHQTHSEQQNAANLAADCSQTIYALVTAIQEPKLYTPRHLSPTAFPTPSKYLSPDLEAEHGPPRYS